MTITQLEQSLIDNAKAHQKAIASAKHHDDADAEYLKREYLKHLGALATLVSLTHHDNGLSPEAAEQLRVIEAEFVATNKLHEEHDERTLRFSFTVMITLCFFVLVVFEGYKLFKGV